MLEPDKLLHNRYQIKRPIGQKQRSVIYEAYDQQLGAPVVIKSRESTEGYPVEMYEQAVRARAWLHHFALPSVRDHFVEDDVYYLVTSHVSGENLAAKVQAQQAGFSSDDVMRWGDQILDALNYLHQREPPVFHRDIKPQNLKLTERNDILLLDVQFASAEEMYEQTHEAPEELSPYVPPELWTDGVWEVPGDLYAFAATMYFLLTGVEPPNAASRLEAVEAGEPDPLQPVASLTKEVGEQLSDLLAEILSLEPSDRPATAASLRSALRYIAVGKPVPVDQEPETASEQQAERKFRSRTVAEAALPEVRVWLTRNRLEWLVAGGAVVAVCLLLAGYLLLTPDESDSIALLPEEIAQAGEETGQATAPTREPLTPTSMPTPTMEPTVEATATSEAAVTADVSGHVSVFDLSPGDCFNDPESLDNNMVNELDNVSCDEPHDNEVFAVLSHPAARKEPYPGQEEVKVFADKGCLNAFEEYVGRAYVESELFFVYIQPTEASWKAGDREVICFLYDGNSNELEGSMAGSQR